MTWFIPYFVSYFCKNQITKFSEIFWNFKNIASKLFFAKHETNETYVLDLKTHVFTSKCMFSSNFMFCKIQFWRNIFVILENFGNSVFWFLRKYKIRNFPSFAGPYIRVFGYSDKEPRVPPNFGFAWILSHTWGDWQISVSHVFSFNHIRVVLCYLFVMH